MRLINKHFLGYETEDVFSVLSVPTLYNGTMSDQIRAEKNRARMEADQIIMEPVIDQNCVSPRQSRKKGSAEDLL
jgi:hypothetical protein